MECLQRNGRPVAVHRRLETVEVFQENASILWSASDNSAEEASIPTAQITSEEKRSIPES